MWKRVLLLPIALLGALSGYRYYVLGYAPGWLSGSRSGIGLEPYLFASIGALLFIGLAALSFAWGARWFERIEDMARSIPMAYASAGLIGLLVGLLVSVLVYPALSNLSGSATFIPFVVSLLLGIAGLRLGVARKDEIMSWISSLRLGSEEGQAAHQPQEEHKILDTSVIIDGRIADICKTGFIQGILVIPEFVLEELQHIADSSDLLKRNRGRRGLDILNKIQKELDIQVWIYDGDFEDVTEVDSKLVRLAKLLGGKVITNDFNLNKVCELQGVSVLNINDLANAVKPVVLPGEEIVVQVIKDGKEFGQGVAYLDDGTMIVVEGGREFIGTTLEVMVTSVLQTSAGRMIFAKPKLLEKAQ